MNQFNTNKNKELLWNILLKAVSLIIYQEIIIHNSFLKTGFQIEIKGDMNAPLVT